MAALQALVEAGRNQGTANTAALEKLLSKIKIAFDSAGRRRLDNDLAGSGIEVVAQGGRKHCLGAWEEGMPCQGSAFQTIPTSY
ncbi:McrBC 5-methylcytosine restriction system component-like protein [Novosphingobium nitrogenifigens DSM 19370]|uniref:McrBC 5-methylcytosine restriction system component-like protein n=1 Tax=Novosphingobium nitrogenifigens DSM 19370 TaxID=983920 RepID=F1ZCX0_9SPHN|nr:McrBC 5-methylcytosine restriction system component-like protein [Novosphingobium nitrogenifigens DSM 19370]